MKRLLISLGIGILTPLAFFVLAILLRAFRVPEPLFNAVLWLLLWPFLSPVYDQWCQLLPARPNPWISLIVGGLLDALIVFTVFYIGLKFVCRSSRQIPGPPTPPKF